MTPKSDVSRETTTTKPDPTDNILLNSIADKSTVGTTPSTPIYAELMEYISARDKLKSERQKINEFLEEVEGEINRCLDEIESKDIVDSKYVITGVTHKRRRTVNPSWFREHEPLLFSKLATVDGKTALRLLADSEGGRDAARKFLRDINPEVYDANASFTIADITKVMGSDAVEAFEYRGAYHIESKRIGDAQLVPIRPGAM